MDDICKTAVDTNGAQIIPAAVAALASLITGLSKTASDKTYSDLVAQDIATVEVAIAQLKMFYDNAPRVEYWKRKELEHLRYVLESKA